MIKRKWNSDEADNWTLEDWLAIVLSPLAYFFLALGTALAIFLRPMGFVYLFLGILCSGLMYYVIDPKLRAISSEYESRQKKYLKELDESVRWEKGK